MDLVSTDERMRAHPAFVDVVRAARRKGVAFGLGLPLFAAAAVYWLADHRTWTAVVAVLLACGNVGAQLYALRRARGPLTEISGSPAERDRAWKLAAEDAKPAWLRWLPYI